MWGVTFVPIVSLNAAASSVAAAKRRSRVTREYANVSLSLSKYKVNECHSVTPAPRRRGEVCFTVDFQTTLTVDLVSYAALASL